MIGWIVSNCLPEGGKNLYWRDLSRQKCSVFWKYFKTRQHQLKALNMDVQHGCNTTETEKCVKNELLLWSVVAAPPCPNQSFPDFVLLLATYQHTWSYNTPDQCGSNGSHLGPAQPNQCSLQVQKLVHTHIQYNFIITENVCLPSKNSSPADGNY